MIAKKLLTTIFAGVCCLAAAGIVVYAAEDTIDSAVVAEANNQDIKEVGTVQGALEINEEATETKVIDDAKPRIIKEEVKSEVADNNKDSIEDKKKDDSEQANKNDKDTAADTDAKDQEKDTKKSEEKQVKAAKTAKVGKEAAKTVKKAKKTTKSYSSADLKLLACLVFAESGNQPYQGKLAVANVVLNRVKSSRFPNTMKAVIYQRSQFTVARNGMLSRELSRYSNYTGTAQKECIRAAKAALEGENNVKGYLFFTRYSRSLANRYKAGKKIGDHYFR